MYCFLRYISDTEKEVKQAESFRLSSQSMEALKYIIELTGSNKTAVVEQALVEKALVLGWRPETFKRGIRSNDFDDSGE